ncbi:MAG TPA: hypothetical protein VJY12_01175 [Dysgonamonadaceae bacterium]|jgi:hypothetical protein|nr:hypothetical protein [Dysgonamonadaceae bacterium]
MDIGDLGFLIIAFIVFIVNFFVKSKKEITQSQKPTVPEMPEPWELKETLPPFPQKRAETLKKKTPRPLLSTHESFENSDMGLKASQEGMSSLSESLYVEDEMESVSYQDSDDTGKSYTNELFHGDITEEFKKAIIYSEILHRKYE